MLVPLSVRFPAPFFVRLAEPVEMIPEIVVFPEPPNKRLPDPVIFGAIENRPLPLWSIKRSVPTVRFPTLVPTVNPISAAAPRAMEILLLPEEAENVKLAAVSPDLLVVKRVRRLVSALAS